MTFSPHLRLATLARDHWELDSSAQQTFKPGDEVRMTFNYADPSGTKKVYASEMHWVEVLAYRKPYYIGTLIGCPMCFGDDWLDLQFGDEVVFRPEHVICVHEEGSEAWAESHWRKTGDGPA
jgi:hypothetical protein